MFTRSKSTTGRTYRRIADVFSVGGTTTLFTYRNPALAIVATSNLEQNCFVLEMTSSLKSSKRVYFVKATTKFSWETFIARAAEGFWNTFTVRIVPFGCKACSLPTMGY